MKEHTPLSQKEGFNKGRNCCDFPGTTRLGGGEGSEGLLTGSTAPSYLPALMGLFRPALNGLSGPREVDRGWGDNRQSP